MMSMFYDDQGSYSDLWMPFCSDNPICSVQPVNVLLKQSQQRVGSWMDAWMDAWTHHVYQEFKLGTMHGKSSIKITSSPEHQGWNGTDHINKT